MSSFPEWALPWLASPKAQVSHGLNLVLELDPAPYRLPLLLWDILLAQDKVKQALEDLSFVHFARFVPSWDGRALMVTTEFDGPLDPYVLDFVTALGDVFDTLLAYVRVPPKLPVREHPEEFLAWVREWNRVPFYLREQLPEAVFPKDFDFPIYSAYPTKTVTDITGPRTDLPRPAIDRPAANVDRTDVQGNILNGYNAEHASYLFFSIANPAQARRWLTQELPDPVTPWHGVGNAAAWGAQPPPVLTQVAFTHDGLMRLLPPRRQPDLATFPKAFQEGASSRATENFDTDSSSPDLWMFGGSTTESVHVVLLLYAKVDPASPQYTAVVKALENGAAKGLSHIRTHTGKAVGEPKARYEHFGFRDGISDPQISGQCPTAAAAFQPAASPGEFVLHKDFKSIYGGSSLGNMPQGLAGNGSFGVLRLMEQDKARFHESTNREAERLGIGGDRLRAKLMGRWPGGDPISLVNDKPPAAAPGTPPKPVETLNGFDYAPSWEFPSFENDHEGLRCPVGAHIRRANPRTARVAGQPHGRRLLRRGMSSEWQEGGVAKFGLMGLFMVADIGQQFEFIQRQWLQGDLAASGSRGTNDPIAAIRSTDTEFHFLEPDPINPALPPILLTAKIPPLVKTRGCLYLFFPGLAALKALDTTLPLVNVAFNASKELTETAVDKVEEAVGAGVDIGQGVLDSLTGLVQNAVSTTSALLSLPDCNLDHWTSNYPALNAWLAQPKLQQLAGGQWREIIEAMIQRKLDAPIVKEIIDSFLPPPVVVQTSVVVDQGGINLSQRSFLANPFDELARLREACKDIVWVKEHQAYWVLGYEGCQDLLDRDADFGQTQSDTPYSGVVTLDDPRHKVVREALNESFTAALAAISPSIDNTVDNAVKALVDQTHLMQFDFMAAFAQPVARAVIWQLVGIQSPAQRNACDVLLQTMVRNFGKDKGRGSVASIVFADAGLRLAARLSLPLSDAWVRSFLPSSPYNGTLIGELAARMGLDVLSSPSRPLHFIETIMTLVQTVVASQSPHFLLSSATLHLLQPDPRQPNAPLPWKQLANLVGTASFNPALELALDETRRHEPPLALIERYAQGPQTICGVDVPDNCAVFAMIASGNRDRKLFTDLTDSNSPDNPEQFHWNRAQRASHISLGHGIHHCAGRFVQEKLVAAALGKLLEAMPDLRLSNPTAVPAWHASIYFRELAALSVARCPP